MARNDRREDEFDDNVIDISRVSKVTKGGRNLRFRVLVTAGNYEGKVGVGSGNTGEIPQAIGQAVRDAKKHIIDVPIVNGTIPHEVTGKFKAGKVVLKPAYRGTGIIAGDVVGTICRLAGLDNMLTKSLGTNNPMTLAKAVIEGFSRLKTPESVARKRGKDVEELEEAFQE
ncbi:MAG: 30S ribosomal protein S5 [Candidatus Bipolaricaulota bacterium]|nr:30S ribosomal protein S5 [Candidatus Bipolaricaulota bacterium]MBS3791242.1 30S ribosomal protein S5 [Candidatus Bipolaricaulota bacterium]